MTTCVWLVVLAAADLSPPGGWRVGPWIHYEFRPTVSVRGHGDKSLIKVLLPRPQADLGQELLGIINVPKGVRFKSRFDRGRLNELMVAERDVHDGDSWQVGCTAALRTRDIALDESTVDASATLSADERPRLRRFLEPTPSTGKGRDAFRAEAERQAADSPNPLTLARRLYDATRDRMNYQRRLKFKGAALAWDDCIGECGDYAVVFVALCRAAAIPARAVSGFEFDDQTSRWELHVWAEFYLHGPGWIPCDPSKGDAGTEAGASYFARLGHERLAVGRDSDLDFGPPAVLKTELVQEYLFTFEGGDRPEIAFAVEGRCLGESLPADWIRKLPAGKVAGARTKP